MAQTTRDMPVRADGWRPTDPVFEGIIKRGLADAETSAARDGVREIMAGAMILVVLAAGLLMAGQSPVVAILLPAALFVGGTYYVASKAEPGPVDPSLALDVVGGAGNLPAGYLVHPGAWVGGMAKHVAYIPESQLRAAADMCAAFPGSVDRLLQFTGTIAAQFPPPAHHLTPDDVAHRARELVQTGLPMIKAFKETYPQDSPGSGGKKGKKKK
jgi:hypothetical protein